MPHTLIFGDTLLSSVLAEAGLPDTLLSSAINRCTFKPTLGAEDEWATLAFVDAHKLRADLMKNQECYAHLKRKGAPREHGPSHRDTEVAKYGTWDCELPVFGFDPDHSDLPDFLLGDTRCQSDFWWYHEKGDVIPVTVEDDSHSIRDRFLERYGRQPEFAQANTKFLSQYGSALRSWLSTLPEPTIIGEYEKLDSGGWLSNSKVWPDLLFAPNSPHCAIIAAAWGADQREKEFQSFRLSRQH